MLFRFDDCEVNVLSGELTRGGRQVPVQAKPFLLLVYLIRNRDRLVEYEELLGELWYGTVVSDAAVRRAMKALRRAIGDDGLSQGTLRTVRGRGYRFVGDVEVVETMQSAPISPLPDPGRDRFVGRDALLDTMDASLVGLSEQRGRLLLLTGEGGIGKSRCLEELARRATMRNIEVHRGACIEGEGTPPFWPWSQVLRSLFAARGRECIQNLLGPAIADLADIDPRLLSNGSTLEAAPSIAPEQAHFRLADSVGQLLAGLASESPMVIVMDDLHWADLASLRLLIHLARELANAPIVLTATYREFEAGLDPHRLELLGELERLKPGATAALRGLEMDELRDFVLERYPAEVPAALLRRLAEQSGGNPFFATQLLGLIESIDGELRLGAFDGRRSAGVLEAVRLQVSRLSEEALEVLRLAAVIGRRFTRGVLVLARKDDGATLSKALSEALRAGLIRKEEKRVESYAFVHALVAEALCHSSDLDWRADAHARVATALEQLSSSMLEPREAEIAHHFLAAGPDCRAKAVIYTRRAGQRANVRAASDEAVVHFERAVQVLEQTPGSQETLCEVLIELGGARTRANDTVGGRESLRGATEIARQRSLPGAFARAAIAYSNEVVASSYQPDCVDLLEEALSWVRDVASGTRTQTKEQGEENLALQSRLLSRLAYGRYFIDPPQRRAELAAEAVELAVRSEDGRAHALALMDHHFCSMGAAPAEKRLEIVDELARVSRGLRDHELLASSELFRIEDALELGETAMLNTACGAEDAIADDLRQPLFRCYSLHHRAMRSLRRGSLADVEALADMGLQLGVRSGNQITVQFYGVQLWSLRRDQGRLEELEAQVASLIQNNPDDSGWRAALACDLIERGELDSASKRLVQLVDHELPSIRSSINWTTTPALLSEVAHRVGDRERARILYEELRPHQSGHVIVSLSMADFGPVDRYMGLCAATYDEALARSHLDRALERSIAAGVAPVTARVRLDLARLLSERDRDRAIELAGRAAADAEAMGMPKLRTAAEAILA